MARILVVDDVATNRELLVTLLGYQGHHMLEASDGAEALAVVRAERPDLVISDILMPTMDGYEFVRQLRADPAIAASAVVFYTAHFRKFEAEQLARSCGVSHILVKPCEPTLILETVQQALGERAQRAAAVPPADFHEQHLRVITDKLSATADELSVTNQRLAALIDICLQLASERDAKRMLENVCRAAREVICAKYAMIGVRSKENGEFAHFATSGIEAGIAANLRMPRLDAGIFSDVLTERRARRVVQAAGDAASLGLPTGHPPVRSALIAPIVSLSHAYGWICLSDKLGAEAFDQEDEELLAILSAQTGRIYENGSLYARLKDHAARLMAAMEERKQAEVTLAQSEQRFRQLAENIRDVFFLRAADSLQILYASPAYEEIWGRSCASLYANPKSWFDAIHPDDRAPTDEKFRHGVLADEFALEYRIVRPDGTIRWIESRGFPVRDETGEIVRIAGVAKDVTERKQQEDEILAARNRLQATLDAIPDLLFELGLDGRYYAFHSPRTDLLAAPPEALRGSTVSEVLPADAAQVVLSALQEARAKGRSIGKQYELALPQGRHWFELSVSCMDDAPGQDPHFICLARDITERKRVEARLAYLNRVHAMRSGINTLIVRVRDPDDLFKGACRIAVEAGGFRMALVTMIEPGSGKIVPVASEGKDDELLCAIKDLLSSDAASRTMVAQSMREKSPVVANDSRNDPRVCFGAKSARSGVRSMAVFPLIVGDKPVGGFTLYAGEIEFFRDEEMRLLEELAGNIAFAIDHIEKENALVRLNAELEDRVAHRTAALNNANKELEAFSFSVSHDLRAPLRHITGFSALMLEASAGKLDATTTDYLNRINAAGERMGQLITDLLALSHVSRQDLHRTDFDLSAMAGEVADSMMQTHPQRQVRLTIAPGMRANGDRRLLRIALENLLGNAWKYTARVHEAEIEVGFDTQNGETVYTVRDNGAGFDMKYAGKLFAPLQRLHADSEFKGTGIGLSIVQRIIARHGGRIWAQAEEGKGAAFHFTLGNGTRPIKAG